MRLSVKVILNLLCFVCFEKCSAHRILGVFTFNARSHMMMFEQLMKSLARRGHQVDVVSTFPLKSPYPNYTDIAINAALPTFVNNMSFTSFTDMANQNFIGYVSRDGNSMCKQVLEYPQMQKIIKNPPTNPPYSLVIVEYFSAPCFIVLGHHFGVPVIGASSAALFPWSNRRIGNPDNLAFIPNNLLVFDGDMTFFERLYNVIHTSYYDFFFDHYTSNQDDTIRKHFGPNAPGVRELEKKLALVLTNSHPVLHGVKPINPALIEVGGLHVQDDGPDISAADRKWLDESRDGFVYFTFGSMVKIESFPRDVISTLYKSLGKIAPVRVFMKIPQPELLPPGLPNNIRTFRWTNQIKVLKHENIRAFISHGGLMGTSEAITFAVPMIAVPLFGDQFANVDLYVKKNGAVRLDYNDITEEKLDSALDRILNNPIYRESAKKLSAMYLDRPLNASDTAIFWVEFIIRHGEKSLRSASLDLTWWQISLLDVYGAILIFAILVIYLFITIVRFAVNFMTKKKLKDDFGKKIK